MKKIILVIIIYICFMWCNQVFAKYIINFELNCFEIKIHKDKEPPTFNVSYSTKDWTNNNVVVYVKPSEEVQEIEEFNFKDGIFQKEVEENESKVIKVLDLAGNEGTLKYEVKNIDKIPPKIIGVENNQEYKEIKYINYDDDQSGINRIQKIYYGDLVIDSNSDYYSTDRKLGIDVNRNSVTLKVLRAPKNIVNFKYYRIDSGIENYVESTNRKFIFNNFNKDPCKYYVVATDINGNSFKSNIIEKSGAYFEDIKVSKTENDANIYINGLEEGIDNIKYNILSLENDLTSSGNIINNNLYFNKDNFNLSNKYKIDLEFFSKGSVVDNRCIYVNLNEQYIKDTNNIFSKNGFYDIIVSDYAGNEVRYTISIEI